METAKILRAAPAWALMLLACESSSAAGFTEPMTFGPREVSAETLNHGRDLYMRHCVSCHGEGGAGDGHAARSLKFPPRDFRLGELASEPASHETLVERIRKGVPERGMPSWKGMREDDLVALADYIKTFSPRWKDADA